MVQEGIGHLPFRLTVGCQEGGFWQLIRLVLHVWSGINLRDERPDQHDNVFRELSEDMVIFGGLSGDAGAAKLRLGLRESHSGVFYPKIRELNQDGDGSGLRSQGGSDRGCNLRLQRGGGGGFCHSEPTNLVA